MKTIWKFPFNFREMSIGVPVGAVPLHVAYQQGVPAIWFECDTDNPVEYRNFISYGTGHQMNAGAHQYIGTILSKGEDFVWHFYEILK